MLAELTTRPQTRPQDHHALFAQLFETYHGRIFSYVCSTMGSPHDADDMTQDAFLKAYRALPVALARGDFRPEPWLFKIATNVCLDALRHRKLVKWQPWDAFVSAFHPSQVATDNPERECVHLENTEEVQLILERLHPKYRLCLVLREYHELSYDEIAAVLDTTRAAVKSLLYRARDEFRLLYAKTEQQPGTPRRTAPAPRPYGGRDAGGAVGGDDFTAYRRVYKAWLTRYRRGAANLGPKPLLRGGRLVFEGQQERATETEGGA